LLETIPHGICLEGMFSQGIVSAVRHEENDTLLQITAAISPGSSGGPILNSHAQTIGIAVATFTGGQNLNLAIPSSSPRSLMEKISADVLPVSRTRNNSEKRSAISDLGGPSVSSVVGESLTWASPYLGVFSFSLRNQLQQGVKTVAYLVIFFDANQHPIEVYQRTFVDTIPAGLARRVTDLGVDQSVHELARHIEIRVLDIRLVD
jgi:hypothetical protein